MMKNVENSSVCMMIMRKKKSFMKPSQLYQIKTYTELRLKHMLLFISLHTHNNIKEEYGSEKICSRNRISGKIVESVGHERAY